MTYPMWPHQQFAYDQFWAYASAGKKRICTVGATGCGKTRIASEITKEALSKGMKVAFSCNRKSLAEQTRKVFEGYGLDPGMRASGYETALDKPLQISMTPTEATRALGKNPSWGLHNADLVFFDEAHNERSARSLALIEGYEKNNPNTIFCGLTATPVDLNGIYDTLIVAGTNSELRECGAHLLCKEFCPTMPDIMKMKRNTDGEFSEKTVEKSMKPEIVFGHILPHYRRLNPLMRPTIVFAPSVRGSITITDMFLNAGIPSAHIDAKHIYYGEKDADGRPVMEDSMKIANREKLFDEVRTGEIKIISSRFLLTEGIDLPQVGHLIFATSYGSLKMYLQAGGRLLRAHDSLDTVTAQDHGANCLQHGSLNDDRIWDLGDSSKSLLEKTLKERKEGKSQEPIICPKCGAMRLSGPACHECGHKGSNSGINILEHDGTLRQMKGPYVTLKANTTSDAIKAWNNIYFPSSKSKSSKSMTFKQALAQFKNKNKHLTVFNTVDSKGRERVAAAESNGTLSFLPMMPPVGNDYLWSQKVRDVQKKDLL